MDAHRNTISNSSNLESFKTSIIFFPKGNIQAGVRTDFCIPEENNLCRGSVFSVGDMTPEAGTESQTCCLEEMNCVLFPWIARQKNQEEAASCFLASLKPQTSSFGQSTNGLSVFPNICTSFTITSMKAVLGCLTVSMFLNPAVHAEIISVYM